MFYRGIYQFYLCRWCTKYLPGFWLGDFLARHHLRTYQRGYWNVFALLVSVGSRNRFGAVCGPLCCVRSMSVRVEENSSAEFGTSIALTHLFPFSLIVYFSPLHWMSTTRTPSHLFVFRRRRIRRASTRFG